MTEITATQAFTPEELHQRGIRTRRLLTYLIIFAIVMFFAGLTSAYVVTMTNAFWVDFEIPEAFYWSTGFIALSSLTIQLALMSAQKDKKGPLIPILLGITLILGLAFSYSQFMGWKALTGKGNYVVGKLENITGEYGVDYLIKKNGEALELVDGQYFSPSDANREYPLNSALREQRNNSSAYFYALTGAHLVHLAFGLISLVVMMVMAALGRYTARNNAGLWSGVTYWHFLGGLWVYLLLFLAFIH